MRRTFEISDTNFGALLSSNMCWKNPTFFHYKKPTFQFRYHELDLGWLVSWMRRCGWNEGFFFFGMGKQVTPHLRKKFPRIHFLFILIFYLLRSGCNLKTCEFCDCFFFRVVKKLSAFTSLSPKKLWEWKLMEVDPFPGVSGSWSPGFQDSWGLTNSLPCGFWMRPIIRMPHAYQRRLKKGMGPIPEASRCFEMKLRCVFFIMFASIAYISFGPTTRTVILRCPQISSTNGRGVANFVLGFCKLFFSGYILWKFRVLAVHLKFKGDKRCFGKQDYKRFVQIFAFPLL